MLAKIVFAGDLHKKIIDPTTIEGYRRCNTQVQRNLMNLILDEKATHFIHLGDWYDRGFHTDNATAIPEYDMDIEMYHMLRGNFYGLIGNHIKLGLDTNPELFLIQPHTKYTPRTRIWRDYQIIKTPDKLKFGTVQISFMHFSGERKSLLGYKPERDTDTTYHIALYHTPWIVPNQQLLGAGLTPNTYTTESIGECLAGVDLAICGDIHDPIGRFVVHHQTGDTIMVVPGSLTNTTSSIDHRHSTIYIPIVTINDDCTVSISFKSFDLLINMLTFKDIEAKKKEKEKLDGIKAKRKGDQIQEGEVRSVFDYSAPDAYSLHNLIIRKGYTAAEVAMIKSILNNPVDIDNLVKLYMDDEPVL